MPYTCRLAPKAVAGLAALDGALQEAVLDELDRLAADPSLIGLRGSVTASVYDLTRRVGNATVYVFITVDYFAAQRHIELLDVAHYRRPDSAA